MPSPLYRRISARTVALTLSATTALILSAAGCAPADPPFDPHALSRAQRQAGAQISAEARQAKRPIPTTLESPYLPSGPTTQKSPPPATGPSIAQDPVVRLSLREIIQRAVANNLDVKVEGYNPAIEETRVVEAEARFDPAVFANIGFQRTDRTSAGQNFSSVVSRPFEDESDTYTGEAGIRQNLEYGGRAEVSYKLTRGESDDDRFAFDPYYENELALELTQPLLRDFGRDVTRARININRLNQRISLLEFRRQLEETLVNLEETYWQLVQAERDVRILEQLLADTVRTAEVLYLRRGQDVTRVQLSQVNATVEQRRAVLIRAKAQVRDLSDRIKQQMNDPTLPVSSPAVLMPASTPVEAPIHFDLEDLIDTALQNRLELGQQAMRVESADILRDAARNNLLPQLNLVGSIGAQGLGEDIGDSTDEQLEFSNLSWAVGLQFEIPIGNREARSIYRRTLLQRQQAVDAYQNLVDQVSLDVKTTMRGVNTSYDEIVATRQARFAAADALEAINQRERANEPLTPEFVQLKLDRQRDLAEVLRQENQSIANYNVSLARLERSKGTLLRYNNVVMAERPQP